MQDRAGQGATERGGSTQCTAHGEIMMVNVNSFFLGLWRTDFLPAGFVPLVFYRVLVGSVVGVQRSV